MVNDIGGGEGEIKVKMVLSAEDFARVLERMPNPIAVESGAGGSTEAKTRGMPVNLEKAIRTSPSFMSIFKPVAALMGIQLGIQGILGHSRIAGAYLGAMGKMFGAAIDLLLMPFIPLFNAIMLGMSMLIKWLITSGVLEKMSELVSRFVDWVKNTLWPDVVAIWQAIKDFDLVALAGAVWAAAKDIIPDIIKLHLKEPVVAILADILAAVIALKIAGIAGGIFGGGGRAAAAGGAAAGSGGLRGLILGRTGVGVGGAVLGGAGAYDLMANEPGTRSSLRDVAAMGVGGAMLGGAVGGPMGAAIGGTGGLALGGAMALSNRFSNKTRTPANSWMFPEGAGPSGSSNSNTWNVTINEAKDPWAVRQELERLSNNELAKQGWEGK